LPVQTALTGQTVSVGPLQWTTLHSGPLMQATTRVGEGEDPQANNAGIIGLAAIGGLRVLFTGDAEPEAQALVLSSGADVAADILKVPHHGSSRQDAAFLAATGAAVAVISVGANNSYGHPTARTLDELRRDGMAIYRTDQVGAMVLIGDGTNLRVHAQHRPP